MPKPINLIVACSENRVIGRDGRLPWRIPEDMEHFHHTTAGQTVLLGRICYETWPGVSLDERQPVVITSNTALSQPHNRIAASVDEALEIAQSLSGEIMVCGGQRIYEETLERADHIILTLVHADVPGDTYFPEWRHLKWHETNKLERSDANYRYTFSSLERIR
jgi:dihydrofolate reductase